MSSCPYCHQPVRWDENSAYDVDRQTGQIIGEHHVACKEKWDAEHPQTSTEAEDADGHDG
jgi:glutaredoxin